MASLRLTNHYSYADIFKAYMDCRRQKRNKRSAIAYETRFERNLKELLQEVNSGTYAIGRSEVFVVTKPKAREIWAARFRDRIVHHLVYNDVGPLFEERFIEDTFSCIKGRGTLAASNRLAEFHRKITNNYEVDCWFLQFDIKNFFVSINKSILIDLFEKKIGADSLTSRLFRQIVLNDPTKNPIIKPNSDFNLIPKHKSLWNSGDNKGLPIGNQTSQFLSNVYLDPMDKFIKHTLGAKYYVRYVDDAVILSRDKSELTHFLNAVKEFVEKHLDISLHPDKCFIKKASQGINFVGYIVKPYRRYTRSGTVNSAKNAARAISIGSIASINSYLGIIKHSDSYRIRREICRTSKIPSIIASSADFSKIVAL